MNTVSVGSTFSLIHSCHLSVGAQFDLSLFSQDKVLQEIVFFLFFFLHGIVCLTNSFFSMAGVKFDMLSREYLFIYLLSEQSQIINLSY